MSTRDDYPHGVPCWVTVLAADVPAAMDFYGELFGWAYETDAPVTTYAVASLEGREVAGIGSLSAAGPGVRPAWMTEVRVDSADAIAESVAAAGGSVLAGPLDLAPAGRLTVIADPAGAVLCGFEAGARKGAQRVNEPGAWAMSSLSTPDGDGAAAFYGTVFGWEPDAFGPMTLWRRPGYVGGEESQPVPRDVVAVMEPPAESARPQWGVGFWVADADGAAAGAERLGGTVLSAPETAGGFRSAVLADPEGAAFTVSQKLA
jgi:predicted enzyme related to lactoylglutathione lyase